MVYEERMMRGVRQPWLAKPAPNRRSEIAGICIHSSRGGPKSSVANDGPATENWMASPQNGSATQGWGGSCDLIIYDIGTRVKVTDWDSESPTYGAGYGNFLPPLGWDCSRYYLQVELAQHIASAPFDDRTIDSLAEWTANMALRYNFPIVRLPFLSQTGNPIPRGITAHDACQNGIRLGKTDPGPLFPWSEYMQKAANYYAALQTEPSPPAAPTLDWAPIKEIMDQGYRHAYEAMNESAAAFQKWDELFAEMRRQGADV